MSRNWHRISKERERVNVKEATAAEGGKCKKEGGFAPAAVDCAVAASNDLPKNT